MRSRFILKLLCSLVEMMEVIVPKARGVQELRSQLGCARSRSANWVQDERRSTETAALGFAPGEFCRQGQWNWDFTSILFLLTVELV